MPPNQDVAGLPPAHAIVAGDDHTCALLENGGVRCWGFRENGRLGDSETTSEPNRPLPPDFDVLTNVKAIAAGAEHTCALTNDDGGVRCWGRNQFGQLGNDSFDDQTKPTDAVLTDVKAIATGSVHTCALMNDGGVRCWGSNAEGQLGMKTEPPHTVSKPPERDLLGDVKSITAGGTHTCVLGNRGDVRCWGSDHSGSTGSSTPVTRLSHCAP
jgi:alpha-tubulin suppressor-like RCC1 family protein